MQYFCFENDTSLKNFILLSLNYFHIICSCRGLYKRSMEDVNNSELSTEEENDNDNDNQESYEEENNNKESFEESNNEESFEEANSNEESTEEGSSSSESTDKDNSSKRSETETEDNKYSDNIAVELIFPKTSEGDIVITSPDYLKGNFFNSLFLLCLFEEFYAL